MLCEYHLTAMWEAQARGDNIARQKHALLYWVWTNLVWSGWRDHE